MYHAECNVQPCCCARPVRTMDAQGSYFGSTASFLRCYEAQVEVHVAALGGTVGVIVGFLVGERAGV